MSIHLPGLVERYSHVPRVYRSERDGEGKTVDERLVEGLTAARTALDEVSQGLARDDLAAFETQGRSSSRATARMDPTRPSRRRTATEQSSIAD